MSTLLSHAPVFAMGSCHRRRNSILIACSRASIRFLIVLRPMTKAPVIQDRVQKCVKPRKSNVSGFPKQVGYTRRPWLTKLLDRRSTKIAAIALANKNARTAWAMMAQGTCYQEPVSQAV